MLPILLLLHAILLFVVRPRRHHDPALRRWLATLERLGYTALYLCSIFIGVMVSITLTWLALDFAETAWFALTGDCRYQRMHPDCVRQSRLMQAATPPMPSTLMRASPTTRYRAPLLPDSSLYSAPHKNKDTGTNSQISEARKNATGGSLADLD